MLDASGIVGGAPEADQAAVVAIVAQLPVCGQDELVYCTGTLVAPRAVLTAKHCLDYPPPGGMVVIGGADALDPAATRLPVIAVYPADTDDVAILALATPFPATPVMLWQTPLDDTQLGTTVRVVGYGIDDVGAVGRKRSGDATIDQVGPRLFRIVPGPALSCNGDSGGPVFIGSELAGVTSFGDSACVFSGTNVRVDVLVDTFITPTLAAIAALPEGAGVPLAPGEDLCLRTCEQNLDCPRDFACVDGRCGYLGMSPGRLSDTCEPGATTGCADTCVPDPAGIGCRCYVPCDGGDPGGCASCGTVPARGRPGSALLLVATAVWLGLRSRRLR